MSIVSIRFNAGEEKILESLSEYFNKEKSQLIKHSLNELYEDMMDRNEIQLFEKKQKAGKVKFLTSEKMLKKLAQ